MRSCSASLGVVLEHHVVAGEIGAVNTEFVVNLLDRISSGRRPDRWLRSYALADAGADIDLGQADSFPGLGASVRCHGARLGKMLIFSVSIFPTNYLTHGSDHA